LGRWLSLDPGLGLGLALAWGKEKWPIL
jgi:hypothetical protein